MPMSEPEVWLRGPVAGYDASVMPMVHALLQVKEDFDRLAASVPQEHLWARPGGAASIGFHIRHTAGALDRLYGYARGEGLSDAQRVYMKAEGEPGEPAASVAAVVADANATIDRALDQLRATSPETLKEDRKVGRAGLPSTVLGLLMHGAEHSTRHAGQAITTSIILRGSK